MCGIAGIVHFDGGPADPEAARAMARCLAHRGPDQEGVYASGNVALSFRRLSIIDLSDKASQPMASADGTRWLVFNGEIYNYVELMSELQSRGWSFRSRSDTEVILHSYEESGLDCTTRFNGMWAFALWDARVRRLVLSRDRLGKKPLYYSFDGKTLLFASEVKALLRIRPELAEPAADQLSGFLVLGETDVRPETLFRKIVQVPPAHTVVFEADGSARWQAYWRAPEPAEVEPIPRERAVSTFRELLYDSVRLRLRSDVPVGTALSGGLDSSSIVAVECDLLKGSPVHTFSSVFSQPELSEERFISAVNAAFPTVPHRITPSSDLEEVLPHVLWHQEVPLIGPGIYSQWCVMELARGKVKVLLDGQGGDELLGGYSYYFPEYLADLLRGALWPPTLGRLLLTLARFARRGSPGRAARFLKEAMRRVAGHPLPVGFQSGTFQEYLNPDLARALEQPAAPRRLSHESFLAAALLLDTTRLSLPRLLHYEDRNSMAHGIEARAPLLDYRIVEFCLRLPPSLRIEMGVTKALLRRAVGHRLPEIVRNRRDKKGFSEPVGEWMRGKGYPAVADLLLSERARTRGIIRRDRIERALAEHRAGIDRTLPLYRALTLELWFRLFVDGEGFSRFPAPPSDAPGAGVP
jgi:asparagine synthase (glutamine-hydrolysing)